MDDLRTDDEWEYEYDPSATETFLVDLDLSSLNGVSKATAPAVGQSIRRAPKSLQPRPKTADAVPKDDNIGGPETDRQDNAGDSPGLRNLASHAARVQILDLPTHNPVVAYQDQIYSCTWTDMIGTNMFFTQPSTSVPAQSSDRTSNYTLLGTSRMKLAGHRAKLTPRTDTTTVTNKRPRPNDDEDDPALEATTTDKGPAGASLPGLVRTNPKTNIEIKAQNAFLERLAAVKRAKGETDHVRFTAKSSTSDKATSNSTNVHTGETPASGQRTKTPGVRRRPAPPDVETATDAETPRSPVTETQEGPRKSRRQAKPSAKQKEIDQSEDGNSINPVDSPRSRGQLDGLDSETDDDVDEEDDEDEDVNEDVDEEEGGDEVHSTTSDMAMADKGEDSRPAAAPSQDPTVKPDNDGSISDRID